MTTKYENAMNNFKMNGISLRNKIKQNYDQDKENYELCLLTRGLTDTEQSLKLNKYMCFIWSGIYNNNKNMYLKGRRKVKEAMDDILDGLMFGDNKNAGMIITGNANANEDCKTINGETEQAREFGNQMKSLMNFLDKVEQTIW